MLVGKILPSPRSKIIYTWTPLLMKSVLALLEGHNIQHFKVKIILHPDFEQDAKPHFPGTIYLDHAGTTPIAKSVIERFSKDMIMNLYGNPHSASPSSQLSTRRIENIRHDVLRFFNADPMEFDLVFVANATAGIKLVMDAFRDHESGFWYGYHRDSHTSLVGVREAANGGSRCFGSDEEVEHWLACNGEASDARNGAVELFAYPAQSNMNGRRLPLTWCRRIRDFAAVMGKPRYTLLDAAALVSTSPLDLSDSASAPDFTVLSFYKIFGFPDLGALIVRKDSAAILQHRRYFGGGTVEMVVCLKEEWHARKSTSTHEAFEDGTLPIHSIMALKHSMDVHQELFGSLEKISQHTSNLAKRLYDGLFCLRHGTGTPVCEIYTDSADNYGDAKRQGATIAFNMRNSRGVWVSNAEVEKLASIRNIQLRTGGLCNPGGIATSLTLAPWEMKENFSAGQRCGNENDIMAGKPTGMIRVSLGAMSISSDVDTFLDFVREFFLHPAALQTEDDSAEPIIESIGQGDFYVESLTVYPIKSCAGWKIPCNVNWEVRDEGLAWDREWCLVHAGTGATLSQKRYPRMALIRPSLDFARGVLRVGYGGSVESPSDNVVTEVTVPLSADPRVHETISTGGSRDQTSIVCGDSITAKTYTSQIISDFFTSALGVPCQLARFPPSGTAPSTRYAKAHLRRSTRTAGTAQPTLPRPLLLSNESPILTISRSSLNRLNEHIKTRGGKAAQAAVFRANIVVAQDLRFVPGTEQPYAEDGWTRLDIGGCSYHILGPCRRCQMICVDQRTAVKDEEPFVTLAKTRRSEGKVWFGVHTCLAQESGGGGGGPVVIRVGDRVTAFGSTDGDGDAG